GRFKYRFGDVRPYGMIAGGSGITPMFQVARYILEGESDQSQTTLDLIYANVTYDDILLKVDVTLQDGRSFEGTSSKYMTDGVLLRETLKDENLDIYSDETAPFFGFLGAATALVFSCMGAVYGKPKRGVGVASMGVMRFELLMMSKSDDEVDLRFDCLCGSSCLLRNIVIKSKGRSDGNAKEKILVLIPETTFVGVESRVLIPETTFVGVESRVLIPETTFVGVESRVLIPETTVWDTLVYPLDTLVIRKQKLG
ncbi:NADH-cytochrome b5 reductase 1, partial [Tanacetum coccineum]